MKTAPDAKAKILIVDDEPAITGLLVAILGDEHDCTTADSAETALELFERKPFDVVLSDIQMGGMSGIELGSRIIAQCPDTVVVMISGNERLESPIGAMRSGAYDYLTKPFDIDQVQSAVQRAVNHRNSLTSKRNNEDRLRRLVEKRKERLKYLANYDSVTGFANRSFFEFQLKKALCESESIPRVAVVLVSLDRYLMLRDTLGPAIGDKLLKAVACRLKEVSKKRAAVARFEGDEFAFWLPDASPEYLSTFVESVFQAFSSPFTVSNYEIAISISVGISLSQEGDGDPHPLLNNAGSALSHARQLGGDNFQFYSSEIHDTARNNFSLEQDLRHAIENGEIEVAYQPKVNTETRRIVGAEALVRWNHPKLGFVPPEEFIIVAEETGLIFQMGEWVLRSACTQAEKWHQDGYPIQIAVNLSPCQFRQAELLEHVTDIVRTSGLDPRFLNLEVTESSIINNLDLAIEILNKFQIEGISVSLDDFGTGYSSFSQLKRLPIEVLKIDRTFVSDIGKNADDASVVMAIITLAHNLGLEVVAEGVETEEQLECLKQFKCDEWQGYLFSRPVSADQFSRLLTDNMSRTSNCTAPQSLSAADDHCTCT